MKKWNKKSISHLPHPLLRRSAPELYFHPPFGGGNQNLRPNSRYLHSRYLCPHSKCCMCAVHICVCKVDIYVPTRAIYVHTVDIYPCTVDTCLHTVGICVCTVHIDVCTEIQ